MNEIVLSIVIGLLGGLIVYLISSQQKEREKLLKMFMAKDLQEVTANEALEKLPEQKIIPPPDNVSMDDAIDDPDLFDRHISAMKAEAKEQLEKELIP